jgi:hypothetical protein
VHFNQSMCNDSDDLLNSNLKGLQKKISNVKKYKSLKNCQKQRIKKDIKKQLTTATNYLNRLGLMIKEIKISSLTENDKICMKIME